MTEYKSTRVFDSKKSSEARAQRLLRTMLAGLADADWCDRAACRDEEPELFFPERTDKRGNLAAQRVCWQCPVLPECRRWVLAARIKHGVWGGMSEQERDKLRKTAGDR